MFIKQLFFNELLNHYKQHFKLQKYHLSSKDIRIILLGLKLF